MNSRNDFNAKDIFEEDESDENSSVRSVGLDEQDDYDRLSTKPLFTQYFKQLTEGCGSLTCTNRDCASSGQICNLTVEEATSRATTLMKINAKLCAINSSKIAKPNTSSTGPYLTEPILLRVLENCKEGNSYGQLTSIIYEVFSSIDNIRNSFLKKHTPHLTDVFTFNELASMSKETIRELEGEPDKDEDYGEEVMETLSSQFNSDSLDIDVPSLRRSYQKLFSLDKTVYECALVRALCSLIHKIQVNLYSYATDDEPLESLLKYVNVFFILFELPILGGSYFSEMVLPQLCRGISRLPILIRARICRVWARYSKGQLRNMLETVQQMITLRVIVGHEIIPNLHEDIHVTSATKLMKMLFYVNILAGESIEPHLIEDIDYNENSTEPFTTYRNVVLVPLESLQRRDLLANELKLEPLACVKPLIPYSEFYNEALSESIPIDKDFSNFASSEMDAFEELYQSTAEEINEKYFSFLAHSFILTPATKSKGLYYDSRIKMYNQRCTTIVENSGSINYDLLHLTLKVRRDHLINDTFTALELFGMQCKRNFRKQLIVQFIGEQALDEGGVSKEFFQLIIEEIFNPDYGVFKWCDQTETFWFSNDTYENESQCSLIGLIIGLAIYNSVILDIRFPKVFYKKLLGKKGVFQDLEDFDPVLYSSLKLLLDHTKDDVEDVFLLNFQVSYTDPYGQLRTFDLLPEGATRPVTKSNKQVFVNLYTDFLLNKSIKNQFNAFRKGFRLATDESPIEKLFRPEEIEILVCGSKVFDLNELRRSTHYDGYSQLSPVIEYLWEFLDSIPHASQRKFLQFTTGSDRIPVGGLSKLNLVIQRNGPDSDRLPTAHTCYNMLLLPEYSTKEKLFDRLMKSIDYSKGFGLF